MSSTFQLSASYLNVSNIYDFLNKFNVHRRHYDSHGILVNAQKTKKREHKIKACFYLYLNRFFREY